MDRAHATETGADAPGAGWQAALIAILLAGGALAWWLQLRPSPLADVAPLAAFPTRIQSFEAVEVPLEGAVEDILRADLNVQRSYLGPDDVPVLLYIGYYGTARGGRPEHTPRGCYTGAGWGIASARVMDLGGGSKLRVNEYVVERGGERRLLFFWFRSHRRTGMVGGFDLAVDKIVGRLVYGRADGALVRLSTRLGDDENEARSRLRTLAAAVDEELARHWPSEDASDGPANALRRWLGERPVAGALRTAAAARAR